MKVNFGKYCGKNIIDIINDKSYYEWLMKQSFFKDKYYNIYDAVINYKPIKKVKEINYNDLPNEIIEYINSFNVIDCGSRGKKLPIYYPLKKFNLDKGSLVMRCKGEKWLTGCNKGKTFKDYSWGYTNCTNCSKKIAGDDSTSYYFLCSDCNWSRNKRKAPLKLHDETTTNYCRLEGMPIIRNNKIVRVNNNLFDFDECLL